MNFKFNPSKILDFLEKSNEIKFDRFNSWKYCFKEFKNINQSDDVLAIHLGFYLASWGMYRGSCGLLQKDYKIHIGGVIIIKEYSYLRSEINNDISETLSENLFELISKLKTYYHSFDFYNNKNEMKKISPTDTLISKIILGTLGCSPAFDRFFIDGVKKHGFNFTRLNQKSFVSIFEFVKKQEKELVNLQKALLDKYDVYYPILKIVDMYFWHEGFTLENKKTTVS